MADKSTPESRDGERIAKVLSRRGIASRREAERLIEMGEVTVNGKVITSPALNVTAQDRITISGEPLPEKQPARLWIYYKPEGLVTSTADEKGRDTVFDHLPEDMPRVMSVGRLDLNSEGLLLLTNDGELKRQLELPSTGWLRKYRVRVNGDVNDVTLQPLREGITIDGERFLPMQIVLDRVQGSNAWLTVGLREGRNREIRRAMNEIGLFVNRLIRVSYGPFRLNELRPGDVEEVRQRTLRDQLGSILSDESDEAPARRPATKAAPKAAGKPMGKAPARPGDRGAERGADRGFDRDAKPASRFGRDRDEAPRSFGTKAAPKLSASHSRPAREGDGIRSLSAAWKTAVTPVSPSDPNAFTRKARVTDGVDDPSARIILDANQKPRSVRLAEARAGHEKSSVARPGARGRDEKPFGAKPAFSKDRDERGGKPFGKPAFGKDRDERGSERSGYAKPAFSKDRDERGGKPFGKPAFGKDRDERPSKPAFGKPSYSKPSEERGAAKTGFGARGGKPEFDRSGPPKKPRAPRTPSTRNTPPSGKGGPRR